LASSGVDTKPSLSGKHDLPKLRPARKAHSPFAMIGFTAAQPCHALITRRCGKSLSKSSTGPEFARPAKTAHPQIESIPEQEHKGTMPSLSWTALIKNT